MQEVIKKLDTRGRIIIPETFRKNLHIDKGATMRVKLYDNGIIIQPEEKRCVFCGKRTETNFKKQNICPECVAELKNDLIGI